MDEQPDQGKGWSCQRVTDTAEVAGHKPANLQRGEVE